MQSTRRGSFSVHRSEKTPGSKYSSTSGLSPRGHLERQAEFHANLQSCCGGRRGIRGTGKSPTRGISIISPENENRIHANISGCQGSSVGMFLHLEDDVRAVGNHGVPISCLSGCWTYSCIQTGWIKDTRFHGTQAQDNPTNGASRCGKGNTRNTICITRTAADYRITNGKTMSVGSRDLVNICLSIEGSTREVLYRGQAIGTICIGHVIFPLDFTS